MKVSRLTCRFLKLPTGLIQSATRPAAIREMVLDIERIRTCWAVTATGDISPTNTWALELIVAGSDRTIVPMLEITISLYPMLICDNIESIVLLRTDPSAIPTDRANIQKEADDSTPRIGVLGSTGSSVLTGRRGAYSSVSVSALI